MIEPEQLAKNGDEHGEQAALFLWSVRNKVNDPRLDLMFAIPNGGERNKVTASRLVAEGVKSGVPDVFLPIPSLTWGVAHVVGERHLARNWYNGLFIEMKKPGVRLKRAAKSRFDTGGVSDNQEKWLAALSAQGYKCVVCYSWLEAANEIKFYLTGTYLDGNDARH